MKIKLAIFDMDGTILETLEDIAGAVNYVLKKNNLPERTLAEVRQFVGNGIHKLIERAVPAGSSLELIEKAYEEFKSYYKTHSAIKTKPYDGIVDMMKALRAAGVRIAVNSNKADFAVQDLCRDFFPGLIDAAIGDRDGHEKKPSPQAVHEIMNKFNVKREETVFIGDSDVDIQTAKNAGVASIAVTWGFRDIEFLKKNGASVLAEIPAQITDYILNT